MPPPLPITWTVEIDFNRDGTYTSVVTDTRLGVGTQFAVGSNEGSASSFTLPLENRDGAYSPRNSAGTYFPYAGEEGIPIRLRATHNAITYTVWTGFIEDWDYDNPGLNRERVMLRCADILSLKGDDLVTVDAVENVATHTAFSSVFTALGLAAAQYDVTDASPQTLRTFHATRQYAREAWRGLLSAEMGGYLYVPTNGKATFRSRDFFLGIASPSTWGDGTNIKPRVAQERRQRGELITKVETQLAAPGQISVGTGTDGSLIVIFDAGYSFASGNVLTLVAGQTVGPYRLVPNQEGVSAIYGTPVCLPGVDYVAAEAISGTPESSDIVVILTQVSGTSYQYDITIKNNHATLTRYLGRLQVRAPALVDGDVSGVGVTRKASAGTIVNDATVGTTTWGSTMNAASSDNLYTTNVISAGATSKYLSAYGFGFAIPSNATILGIMPEAEANTTDTTTRLLCRINKGGTILTTVERGADLTTTEAYKAFGGGSELWGTTWTPADINNANFGFAVYFTDPTACTVSVDHVRITVFYVLDSGSAPDGKKKGPPPGKKGGAPVGGKKT